MRKVTTMPKICEQCRRTFERPKSCSPTQWKTARFCGNKCRGKSISVHGLTDTAEHRIWMGIIARCENENCKDYKNYGARGILVCREWRNSFQNFLADMGKRPSGNHSIDRRDNNGGYNPANCYWATRSQQQQNRRSVQLITINGERVCLQEAARRLGMLRATLARRLAAGWTEEIAISTPVKGNRVRETINT